MRDKRLLGSQAYRRALGDLRSAALLAGPRSAPEKQKTP
jgi:hypothetical protein